MQVSEYVEQSGRTVASSRAALLRSTDESMDLLHVAIGLSGEAAEFADAIKKHVFYGAELDRVNLMEEIGDLMWYVAYACRTLGLELEDVMTLNISKLKKRYPEKFSLEKATKRDLVGEHNILIGGG